MTEKKIFQITEIIESQNITEFFIYKCIKNEWISPCHLENTCFDEEDISRILLIKDLIDDFEVNDEAIPLILHLIDQMYWLQSQIKFFLKKLNKVNKSNK